MTDLPDRFWNLQQRADIYLSYWRLLWPLPRQERIKRWNETVDDFEYEEVLALVSEQMMEAA